MSIHKSFQTVIKENVEYYIIPAAASCGHPKCGTSDEICPGCNRKNLNEVAHIPTGRMILHERTSYPKI